MWCVYLYSREEEEEEKRKRRELQVDAKIRQKSRSSWMPKYSNTHDSLCSVREVILFLTI
jgi:hypothetical protein